MDPEFPVREAPTVQAWPPDGPGQPGASEPVLAMADIQGNVVAGFNKNFQTLLHFRIEDAGAFRRAAAELGRRVATADEVLAFNRLFKRMRDRRGYSSAARSTWVNVAFSFAGLRKLRRDAEHFADPSFRDGAGAAADVLIIVAADDENDLAREVRRTRTLVEQRGATFVGRDEGKVRSDAVGHEHFGFLDGISQPGLRGRASEDPTDLLTPRQNRGVPDEGKPGQELVWPGEFVFGYPGQIGSRDGREPGGDASFDGAGSRQVPDWARDGSYLVFLRLRQDVFRFHRFLRDEGARRGISAEAMGARIVGRWPSGAPVLRAPGGDDPDLADNDCANNHFRFRKDSAPVAAGCGEECCPDRFPRAAGDPQGLVCPLDAHIRKVYPRDDIGVRERRLHRMIRRGIPYGAPSPSTPRRPLDDGEERGLLFLAYMTSIGRQFDFVRDQWVRKADLPVRQAGTDALLDRPDWIVPMGGGAYFTPSVSALEGALSS